VLFLMSIIPLLLVGVGAIGIYALSLAFGKSDSENAPQQLGLVSDASLSDDDTDKVMWEAGKHDIAKAVDVQFAPKLHVREIRTPEQIQEEEQVDEKTALAMSSEELDDFIKPDRHDPYDDFTTLNPATGLPMMGGIGGIDVAGNPYGFDNNDMHHDDSISDMHNNDDWHRSSFDD
jgi:hypothetical protein